MGYILVHGFSIAHAQGDVLVTSPLINFDKYSLNLLLILNSHVDIS